MQKVNTKFNYNLLLASVIECQLHVIEKREKKTAKVMTSEICLIWALKYIWLLIASKYQKEKYII